MFNLLLPTLLLQLREAGRYEYHGHAKEVYLYPLRRDFRRIIGCTQRPPKPRAFKKRSWCRMMLTGEDWNPDLIAQTNLTVEEVQGLAGSLLEFHRQFHDCFQREEQRVMSLVYMKGPAHPIWKPSPPNPSPCAIWIKKACATCSIF